MSIDNTLKAINDKTRRDILKLLKQGRMNANEIAKHFNICDATVSHHLSVLLKAGLIFWKKKKIIVITA